MKTHFSRKNIFTSNHWDGFQLNSLNTNDGKPKITATTVAFEGFSESAISMWSEESDWYKIVTWWLSSLLCARTTFYDIFGSGIRRNRNSIRLFAFSYFYFLFFKPFLFLPFLSFAVVIDLLLGLLPVQKYSEKASSTQANFTME